MAAILHSSDVLQHVSRQQNHMWHLSMYSRVSCHSIHDVAACMVPHRHTRRCCLHVGIRCRCMLLAYAPAATPAVVMLPCMHTCGVCCMLACVHLHLAAFLPSYRLGCWLVVATPLGLLAVCIAHNIYILTRSTWPGRIGHNGFLPTCISRSVYKSTS